MGGIMTTDLDPNKMARHPNTPKGCTQTVLNTKKAHPNLSSRQIGKIAGCTHGNVIDILQRYGIVQKRTKSFITNRAEIFAGMQDRLLSSITDKDIAKMPAGSRLLGICQLYDKERLERDKSTANVMSLHKDIAALKSDNVNT